MSEESKVVEEIIKSDYQKVIEIKLLGKEVLVGLFNMINQSSINVLASDYGAQVETKRGYLKAVLEALEVVHGVRFVEGKSEDDRGRIT